MKRLRPGTTVLGGAVIGLFAGAVMYSAATTESLAASAPTSQKVPKVSVAAVPPAPVAPVAHCASGQTLEHGVCIIHVKRVKHVVKIVVRPSTQNAAAAPAQRYRGTRARTVYASGSSSSRPATRVRRPAPPVAAEGAEHDD